MADIFKKELVPLFDPKDSPIVVKFSPEGPSKSLVECNGTPIPGITKLNVNADAEMDGWYTVTIELLTRNVQGV